MLPLIQQLLLERVRKTTLKTGAEDWRECCCCKSLQPSSIHFVTWCHCVDGDAWSGCNCIASESWQTIFFLVYQIVSFLQIVLKHSKNKGVIFGTCFRAANFLFIHFNHLLASISWSSKDFKKKLNSRVFSGIFEQIKLYNLLVKSACVSLLTQMASPE